MPIYVNLMILLLPYAYRARETVPTAIWCPTHVGSPARNTTATPRQLGSSYPGCRRIRADAPTLQGHLRSDRFQDGPTPMPMHLDRRPLALDGAHRHRSPKDCIGGRIVIVNLRHTQSGVLKAAPLGFSLDHALLQRVSGTVPRRPQVGRHHVVHVMMFGLSFLTFGFTSPGVPPVLRRRLQQAVHHGPDGPRVHASRRSLP